MKGCGRCEYLGTGNSPLGFTSIKREAKLSLALYIRRAPSCKVGSGKEGCYRAWQLPGDGVARRLSRIVRRALPLKAGSTRRLLRGPVFRLHLYSERREGGPLALPAPLVRLPRDLRLTLRQEAREGRRARSRRGRPLPRRPRRKLIEAHK